jgi:hypothetical protein
MEPATEVKILLDSIVTSGFESLSLACEDAATFRQRIEDCQRRALHCLLEQPEGCENVASSSGVVETCAELLAALSTLDAKGYFKVRRIIRDTYASGFLVTHPIPGTMSAKTWRETAMLHAAAHLREIGKKMKGVFGSGRRPAALVAE